MRGVNGLNHGSKNRLKLWLRGEKAFGLTAVPSPPLPEPVEAAPQALDLPKEVSRAAPMIARTPIQENSLAKRVMKPAEGRAESQPALIAPPALPTFTTPILSRDEKIVSLQLMDEGEVKSCTKCRLHETRTNTVFGEGDPDATIFFVGEGPGENEDLSGRPFVGRAGQLLDKMIAGMGLSRQQVFIANIVKCRPPNNRVPGIDEVATCTPYLERQLEIVRPRVIVTLGRPATTYMLNSKASMGSLRGKWQTWRGIKLMPTFHPSYVLRSYTEEVRAAVWSDLKQVLVELGMKVPEKSRQ